MAATVTRTAITGVILAGGQGKRMGGVDKGRFEVAGRPLLEYVLEALRPQVDDILINANRNQEQYAALGCAVVNDELSGFPGPLAGVAAAMARAETPWILTVPCDAPLLPVDLAGRLAQAARPDSEVIIAHDGERDQRLFALWRRDLLASLRAFLAGGGHAVHRWLHGHTLARADFSDCPQAFTNVNSPEQAAAIETLLRP